MTRDIEKLRREFRQAKANLEDISRQIEDCEEKMRMLVHAEPVLILFVFPLWCILMFFKGICHLLRRIPE